MLKHCQKLQTTRETGCPIPLPGSPYVDVYSFKLDLCLLSFCLWVLVPDSCKIKMFRLPSTSSQVLNSLNFNTLSKVDLLHRYQRVFMKETSRAIQNDRLKLWKEVCVTQEFVIIYCIWVTPFKSYLGQY